MKSRKRTRASRSTASESTKPPRATPSPLDVAARILTHAPRSEADLHARLVARGYQPTTATRTVDRCRELGYVGDEKLARERARQLRERGAGSLKIGADLEARGLPEAIVFAAVEGSCEGEPESAWARRALDRAGRPRGAKAWRLLASRGFPEDVVRDVLGDLPDDVID